MADEARPPYVKFETRAVEDRNASIEAGHYVGKDIIFAIITPVGSRDTVERPADDWIAYLDEGVKNERIPSTWLAAYKRALKDFQESRETPENGTPLTAFSPLSPAQLRTCLDINVRTVEELADANAETLSRIGMGAVALKQKAADWLASANNIGKTSEEMSALKTENAELRQHCDDLEDRLKKLEAKLTEEEDA